MKNRYIFFIIMFFITFSDMRAGNSIKTTDDIPVKNPNPVITEILSGMNKDSLVSVMQSMVNMGTRFMYSENRKQVAMWIAAKFMSYGYTDVVLDSFKVPGETIPKDSVWQYNVVATFPGSSAPGETYIIGAHHDDYATPNPHISAPGADDNASGCAVALEIARVLNLKGFQPASTIKFVTFAAEELVGYNNYSGSIYYANKLAVLGQDLRLVICNDMVANTQGTGFQIFGVQMNSGTNVWAGNLTASSAATYSSLEMIQGPYPTSDGTRFWDLGYPVSGFEEYGLSPTYHTINDSVRNCNMELCFETAKANAAILLNEQLTPVPQKPSYTSTGNGITVSWLYTANTNVSGFRVYRSTSPDSGFVLAQEIAGHVFSYSDQSVMIGTKYYYYITSYNEGGFESTPSNITWGAAAPRYRPLLVVKDTKGGYNYPSDSAVTSFYLKAFSNLTFDYTDASVTDSLDLSILNKYERICWLSNSYTDQTNSSFKRHREEVMVYIRDGGKLFLDGFMPSYMIMGNTKSNKTFSPNDTIYQYFKISKVERKPQALLNGAFPVGSGYDSLRVDPEKCIPQVPGHLMNVESFYPAPDASLIYRWCTAYDSTSAKGQMKNKPVGIEYLGNDFKVIILSVPVYYLDSADARKLVELVVREKFKNTVGITEKSGDTPYRILSVSPNPANHLASVSYMIDGRSEVVAELINSSGHCVFRKSEGIKSGGVHNFDLQTDLFSPGVYIVAIRAGTVLMTGKIIISR